MRNGVGETLQFLVGRAELGRALLYPTFEIDVQSLDLFLGAPGFGDVLRDPDHTRGPAVVVEVHVHVRGNPADVVAGVTDAEGDSGAVIAPRFLHLSPEPLPCPVAIQLVQLGHALFDGQGRLVDVEVRAGTIVEMHDGLLDVIAPGAEFGGRQSHAIALTEFFSFRFGFLARRDVHAGAGDQSGVGVVRFRIDAPVNGLPAVTAVALPDAVLGHVAAVAERRLDGLCALEVLRMNMVLWLVADDLVAVEIEMSPRTIVGQQIVVRQLQAPDADVGGFERKLQMLFLPLQFIRGPSQVFDVGSGADPADDLPGIVADRYRAGDAARVLAVVASYTVLAFEGLAPCQQCAKPFAQWSIVRMEAVGESAAEQLLARQPGEEHALPVDELDAAVGRSCPGHRRQKIDQLL